MILDSSLSVTSSPYTRRDIYNSSLHRSLIFALQLMFAPERKEGTLIKLSRNEKEMAIGQKGDVHFCL